jgi:hypothetical protein
MGHDDGRTTGSLHVVDHCRRRLVLRRVGPCRDCGSAADGWQDLLLDSLSRRAGMGPLSELDSVWPKKVVNRSLLLNLITLPVVELVCMGSSRSWDAARRDQLSCFGASD